MALHIHRRLIRWGNGFGIRLTQKEAAQLGLHAGDEVEADIQGLPSHDGDWNMPAWPLGGPFDIDEEVAQAAEEEAEEHGRR